MRFNVGKRILCCLLACIFVMGYIPAGALALEIAQSPSTKAAWTVTASGTCGKNLTWVLADDGVLTISGTGAMADYRWCEAPWFDYSTSITKVVIEAGVTSIGNYAFCECSSLTGITIPGSVTSIGNYAFDGCSNLTGITIPDSVTSIVDYAFYNCRSLTGITIPDSVTSIGNFAFYNCSSLTSITIPDSVTSIGNSAFSDCSSLTSITIPEGVTSIGDWAFFYCSSLTGIWVSEGNSSYCSDEFGVLFNKNKTVLLQCPGGLEGEYTIPEGVTRIGGSAFRNCTSLTGITIPNGVTSIGNGAFFDCSSLTSITIPEGVTSISNYAFFSCSSLTGITIPDSVTSIGNEVFSGCSSLTSITIPEGVTSIGDWAFCNCSSLASITIPEGVTSIGDGTFRDCSSLTGITIPDSVTSIGVDAFNNCTSLESITIPEGVTSIGYAAFSYCSSLTGVWVSEGTSSYCSDEFGVLFDKNKTVLLQCPGGLEGEYTIPEGVTSIGGSAFSGCASLTGITIPNGVTSIGENAFTDCPELTSAGPIGGGYNIEFGWTKAIPSYAFDGCNSLTSVVIPEGVTSIGKSAFYDCSSLTSITIPEGVTSIGNYAFFYCSSLKGIWVSEENPRYSSDEFGVLFNKNKTVLLQCPGGLEGEYTIPEGVTSIGGSAFRNCTSLTGITIPDSVTSIGNFAFSNCNSLTSITFEGNTPAIGNNVFSDVTATAYYPADNATWTGDVMWSYGGTITWMPSGCEHCYGEWVVIKAPTFTDSGTRQKTCSVCGHVITGEIPPASASVEKWNISLVDDLLVNFHLKISQSIESTAKVKISLAEETFTYDVKDLEKTEEGLYVVPVELAAAQMTEDIELLIVDKNQIGCDANYTVRQYADSVLADESLSSCHELVRQMLNYGAAAQNYFGYDLDVLANEGITGVSEAEIPEKVSEPMEITGAAEGVNFYAASLSYRERIAIRFYFGFVGDINACTFKVNGEELSPGLKNGLYYVDVPGITPEKLDQQVEVVVTGTDGQSLSIQYSPMNYIVRMNAKGSESLKALLKALYNYHLAAKELKSV